MIGNFMEFNKNTFYKNVEKEIARLEKTVKKLKGDDKKFVLDIMDTLEQECREFKGTGNSLYINIKGEEKRVLGSIIDMLNKIEMQVKDLEVTVEKKGFHVVSSRDEANRIINQFFYDCQVAEKQIKHYGKKGDITRKQITELNGQLKKLVHSMITLSKKSEFLIDAILQSYEIKLFS